MSAGPTPEESQQPPVVIRDKRRIDPESGEVRAEAAQAAAPAEPAEGGIAPNDSQQLVAALEERTEDLLRVKAEYDNYRRRVERDRAVAGELGAARVLAGLLSTLDDIYRAREHGQLDGAFRQVAEGLEKSVQAIGLDAFGEVGEVFDPTRHDALMHSYSDDVEVPTIAAVMGPGYTFADRVLRPAQVAVTEPNSAPDSDAAEEPSTQADPATETDS